MNYTQVKKLDEDTQKNLQEGFGPVDECLCSLLAPPEESKGLRGSIKKALASIGGRRASGTRGAARGAGGAGGHRGAVGRSGGGAVITGGQNTVEIPLTFEKGGKGIFTTKEEVKRATSCGKCGCDNEKFFLKHSYANIRITSPDVSTICPCPSSACMPGKDKLNNNISVTVEHVAISDNDTEGYDTSAYETKDRREKIHSEKAKPVIDRSSAKELVEHMWKEWENREGGWCRNIEEDISEDAKTLDCRPEDNYINTLENSETEDNEKIVLNKPDREL